VAQLEYAPSDDQFPSPQTRGTLKLELLAAWSVRHFLFSFHESTLEVLGNGLDVSVPDDPFEAIVNRMQAWLLEDA
jgi:hypothetical protein